MFLEPSELARLTGRKQAHLQITVLRQQGVPFFDFLLDADGIAYVGLSNHVGLRLVDHRRQKHFSHVFVFEAPQLLLPHIEAHYIDSLSPPLNMPRFYQRDQFRSPKNNRKRIAN